MDEISTVIFSLGNSSYYLPQEKIVDLEQILRPLVATPDATPLDSGRFLLAENNHPPAYFMLAHLWMDLFPNGNEAVSLFFSRLFSVLLGTLSIPVIFWVTKNAFQSSLAGLISAAFMAVSPFSVFLTQEARHYGLAITLISLSLGYFVIAAHAVVKQKRPAWAACFIWVLVNGFAFATHYFSALTITAEGLIFAAIAWQQTQKQGISVLRKSYWQPIYIVALGSAASILVWLPILLNFYGSPQTTFLIGDHSILKWVNPIAQTFAAVATTLVTPANFYAVTPLEISLMVISIVLTLALVFALIAIFIKGARYLAQKENGRLGLQIVGGFWVVMLMIFAVICYGYGADITRGLRYTFSYYPAIMILVGGIFSLHWAQRSPQDSLSFSMLASKYRLSGRRIVQVTWLISLISSLFIVTNLAFPKYYAPEKFVPFVQQNSNHPIVFASTEKIFKQPTVIGAKFLSIAWEIERNFPPEASSSGWQSPPQFFVLKEGYGIEKPLTQSLAEMVAQLSGTTDLWVIRPEVDAADPLIKGAPKSCSLVPSSPHGIKSSYSYIHFECGA